MESASTSDWSMMSWGLNVIKMMLLFVGFLESQVWNGTDYRTCGESEEPQF